MHTVSALNGQGVNALIKSVNAAHAAAFAKLSTPRLTRELQAAVEQQRSEEHTSELQSLMRISYAVFCLKKKKKTQTTHVHNNKIELHNNEVLTYVHYD